MRKTGYILYCNRMVKIQVLEITNEGVIVETDYNEIIAIPNDMHVVIWPTKEMKEDFDMIDPWFPPAYKDPKAAWEARYYRALKYIEEHTNKGDSNE